MFEAFEKRIIQKTITVLAEIVSDVSRNVDENTPEDTFELISRTQVEMPKLQGDSIRAKVFNDDPKAKFVEYGQEPKQFNYYKKSGRRKGGTPFYSGVGAQMFRRAKEALIPTLHEKLLTIVKK